MILMLGLLFTILILGFIGGIVVMPVGLFIDLPSLLIIIIPTIFFMVVTKTYKSVCVYFKGSFKSGYQFTERELKCLSHDLGDIIKMLMASGVFAFIAGLIGVLVNFSDPTVIGPNFAVSLISEFYAVIISFFIFYPTKVWAERTLRDYSERSLQ